MGSLTARATGRFKHLSFSGAGGREGVMSLFDTARHYDPVYYEPKDFAREAYLERTGRVTRAVVSWSVAFKIALLVAVGVVWRLVMPSRAEDRQSVRR